MIKMLKLSELVDETVGKEVGDLTDIEKFCMTEMLPHALALVSAEKDCTELFMRRNPGMTEAEAKEKVHNVLIIIQKIEIALMEKVDDLVEDMI